MQEVIWTDQSLKTMMNNLKNRFQKKRLTLSLKRNKNHWKIKKNLKKKNKNKNLLKVYSPCRKLWNQSSQNMKLCMKSQFQISKSKKFYQIDILHLENLPLALPKPKTFYVIEKSRVKNIIIRQTRDIKTLITTLQHFHCQKMVKN